jgi:hypothetical protein
MVYGHRQTQKKIRRKPRLSKFESYLRLLLQFPRERAPHSGCRSRLSMNDIGVSSLLELNLASRGGILLEGRRKESELEGLGAVKCQERATAVGAVPAGSYH